MYIFLDIKKENPYTIKEISAIKLRLYFTLSFQIVYKENMVIRYLTTQDNIEEIITKTLPFSTKPPK